MLSTLAYFVIYLGLREITGPQVANLIALVITAVANTATNRGSPSASAVAAGSEHHAGGLIAFGVGLALTSGSLWAAASPGRQSEPRAGGGVLVIANASPPSSASSRCDS